MGQAVNKLKNAPDEKEVYGPPFSFAMLKFDIPQDNRHAKAVSEQYLSFEDLRLFRQEFSDNLTIQRLGLFILFK